MGRISTVGSIALASLALVSLAGCKHDSTAGTETKTSAGPLTRARLEGAKAEVKLGSKFPDTLDILKSRLGPPTRGTDSQGVWSVVEDTKCTKLTATKYNDGTKDIALVSVTTADKAMKSMFDDCAASK